MLKSILPIFTLIFCFFQISLAQEARVSVIDKNTNKPLPYANVSASQKDNGKIVNGVTNIEGIVLLDIRSKATLSVSYVGYQKFSTEISPGQNVNVKLTVIPHKVDEVVVTAQYTPTSASKSIYKVNVIDKDQISLKASTDLREVLSNELNISLQQDNILGSSMSLQGISGENVKILIDGVPIVGRLNGNVDLSQINMNNIERIEVIEGPMSVNYGTNALAGVINLITKDRLDSKYNLGINGVYESVGKYNLDLNGGLVFDKYQIMVSGGRNFFDGFSVLDNESRFQEWKPKEQYFTDFKYKRKFAKLNLIYNMSYFNEFVLDRGEPFKDADTTTGYYYYVGKDGKYFTNRLNNSIGLQGLVFDKHFMDVTVSNAFYRRIKKVYYKNLYLLDEELSGDFRDHDTSVFNSYIVRGTLSMFQDDSSKFNYQYGFDINIETGEGKKIENHTQRIDDYAVFTSIKYNPVQRFTIQPAFRFAYNSKYNTPITPSLNLKYDFNSNFILRGSYAKGFRAPSLKELYLDFVDLNHDIHGNPELDAEKSDNINLNLAYTKITDKYFWKIEPTLFFNIIHGMIDLVPKMVVQGNNGQDTSEIYLYENVEKYKTVGGKFQFTYNNFSNFSFKTGFSEIGRYNSSFSGSNGIKEFEFTPEFSLSSSYKFTKLGLKVFASYKYTGELTRSYLNLKNEIYTYKEADFHNLDVSLNKTFFDNALILTIGGKNLFDVKNIRTIGGEGGVHTGSSSSRPVNWGRTFFVSLNYKFKK